MSRDYRYANEEAEMPNFRYPDNMPQDDANQFESADWFQEADELPVFEHEVTEERELLSEQKERSNRTESPAREGHQTESSALARDRADRPISDRGLLHSYNRVHGPRANGVAATHFIYRTRFWWVLASHIIACLAYIGLAIGVGVADFFKDMRDVATVQMTRAVQVPLEPGLNVTDPGPLVNPWFPQVANARSYAWVDIYSLVMAAVVITAIYHFLVCLAAIPMWTLDMPVQSSLVFGKSGWRWVEYSISVSLLLTAIAGLVGVRDAVAYTALIGLSVMMFCLWGIGVEVLSPNGPAFPYRSINSHGHAVALLNRLEAKGTPVDAVTTRQLAAAIHADEARSWEANLARWGAAFLGWTAFALAYVPIFLSLIPYRYQLQEELLQLPYIINATFDVDAATDSLEKAETYTNALVWTTWGLHMGLLIFMLVIRLYLWCNRTNIAHAEFDLSRANSRSQKSTYRGVRLFSMRRLYRSYFGRELFLIYYTLATRFVMVFLIAETVKYLPPAIEIPVSLDYVWHD